MSSDESNSKNDTSKVHQKDNVNQNLDSIKSTIIKVKKLRAKVQKII